MNLTINDNEKSMILDALETLKDVYRDIDKDETKLQELIEKVSK